MKVVHISTSKHGGAGIAAFRIHEALNKFGEIDSYFLQRTDNDDIVNKTYQIKAEIKKENFLSKIKRRLNLTNDLEYRNKRNEINKSRNFEIATFPESSFRIEDHPLIKDADIIHLHWVADFLNYPTFFKRIKKPIVWTLHDMNPFQGLFHYKNDEINNEETFGDFNKKILKEKIKSINITIPEPTEEIGEGFDEVENTSGSISFIDHDVKDADFPEEGTIGELFDFGDVE